jgi:ribose transport system permease protein
MSAQTTTTTTSSPASIIVASASDGSIVDRLTGRLGRYGVLLTFAAVFAFFAIDIPSTFLTGQNLADITNSAAVDALLAVGITVPLIIGDFDLSVGSGASLGGALAIVLMSSHTWAPIPAVAVALALGLTVGLISGVVIGMLGASSFIITLAMGSVLTGIEFLFTKQQTIVVGIPQSFVSFGTDTAAGLEIPVYLTVAIALGIAFCISQTPAGRYVRAVGANQTASRLLGLPVTRLRIVGLMLSAGCAALAGIFIVATAGNSFPNAGEPHLLPAFAAAFLGSTLFPSRRFSLIGSCISAWLLGMVATGLVELNLQSWTIDVFDGLVLIVAIVTAMQVRCRS